MANKEQLAILRRGVEVWNRWRDENPHAIIDLQGGSFREDELNRVNLSRANLWKADFRRANLQSANFTEAYLCEVRFWQANLNHAKLQKVDLYLAELDEATISGASFFDADLMQSNLNSANLRGTDFGRAHFNGTSLLNSDFTGAVVYNTTFSNIDMSQIIGLESVSHSAPSSISTDTIANSKGKIPEVFLRGCGLPDWDIEGVKLYNPCLNNDEINQILYKIYDLRATQALQISPLFISYNHIDAGFVDKVGNQLSQKGIRYWRDIHNMKAGRMEKQIDRAVRQNPIVLLVLSEHSLSSDWVEHEVRTASTFGHK